jgi:hypothetical protein
MRRFIIKSFIFVVPIVLLINIPKVIPFTFHNDLNRKINTLIDDNDIPTIIIGGDSRAERQLKPLIFEEKLGLCTVNIAVNSGDISMLYNGLKKYNLMQKDNTLIISVSSIEINDNVINKWGIPHAAVTNISFLDNLVLFNKHFLKMLHERFRLIFEEVLSPNQKLTCNNDDRIASKGFMGIEGDISEWDFETVDISEDTLKVGWYLNSKHNGARKDVFNKVIEKLAKTGMNIIVFQPPISPSWHSHTNGTYIDSLEIEHSQYLNKIASTFSNISFIDFYTNFSSVYHDSMFYNSIHFNIDGADIFSNMFVDSLTVRNLVDINTDKNKSKFKWESFE